MLGAKYALSKGEAKNGSQILNLPDGKCFFIKQKKILRIDQNATST